MTGARPESPALIALLERLVDYAGLFPPAKLAMADAVRAYADYRHGPHAWMLGRFVLPVSQLEAFVTEGGEWLPTTPATSWALSALVTADAEIDMQSVHRFNAHHRDPELGAVYVDTVELKASDPDQIAGAEAFISGFDAYVEVPVLEDPGPLVGAIAGIGAKAKIRTGGVTPEAIPGARHVVRFMRACMQRGVAFKATAGLHHPLRAEYPLSYDDGAPRGTMFGFLNVFLAAAFIRAGADDTTALALLEERDPAAIQVEPERVRWREHVLGADELRLARHEAVAFGSCSFREPVDELRALGLLP